MIVVVGLGPIGAGVGAALVDRGERVFGIDPDSERAAEWGAVTGMPVAASLEGVPDWAVAEVVVVAVRLAEQLRSVLGTLPVGAWPVFVLTTLSVGDARALADSPHVIVEAPVSGGAGGARAGELAMYLHSPELLGPAARRVVDGVTKQVFSFDGYGRPAVAKLANNTLAAYHALAVAGMADVAARVGLDRAAFLDVVSSSSGQSWISDHFAEFAPDLLFKDVALLQQDVHDLPVIDLADIRDREAAIDEARSRLAAGPTHHRRMP